jgi:hypothetical protein
MCRLMQLLNNTRMDRSTSVFCLCVRGEQPCHNRLGCVSLKVRQMQWQCSWLH